MRILLVEDDRMIGQEVVRALKDAAYAVDRVCDGTRNAVDNALRYTGFGGRVDVSLYREGDQLVFLVEDSGMGIPAGAERRLFEPFYRAPGNAEPGSGLGLAIIRSIAERLGGQATLGNREGTTGARFCYRQPLPPAL